MCTVRLPIPIKANFIISVAIFLVILVGTIKVPNSEARWKHVLKKELHKRFGILRWLPKYSKMDAISDMIAGITLGLTIVPQSIAYASLARLPPETGLYSAFAGGFLYVLFGTIKQVSIGPTSLMSLLTLQYISNVPQEYLLNYLHLLTFLCGLAELLMGILRLGFLTEFISQPVISGFTSASAIIIIVSQVKHVLGVNYRSDDVKDDVIKLFHHIQFFKFGDTILGISCIILLLFLRQLKNCSFKNKLGRKICWFISVGRNAIVVLLCCLVAFSIERSDSKVPFKLTSNVTPGLPEIKSPAFGMTQGNRTVSFIEMIHQLKSGFIVIPIVAVLINVSIAKAFATGGTVDATQEMLTLSLCNIFASFFSSMPICGAFTRSAVSNASGVKTPFSNFYSSIITILALTFLTPSFRYIPKATLAAVLIAAVIFLIDVQLLFRLWKSSKQDLCVLLITVMLCLYFGVEIGLLIGVLCNLAHLLYLWARPKIRSEKCKNEYGEYIIVTPELGLFYLGSDYLYTYLIKVAKNNHENLPIAVNCCYFKGIDYSAIQTMTTISEDFKSRNQKLVFFNVYDGIKKKLVKSRVSKRLQLCGFSQNLNEFLFSEVFDFRRSVTIPVMDTESKGNETEANDCANGNLKLENVFLLNENGTKDIVKE